MATLIPDNRAKRRQQLAVELAHVQIDIWIAEQWTEHAEELSAMLDQEEPGD